jgi:hypothetical protein
MYIQVEKALGLEQSIRSEIENAVRARCNCDFSSTAIHFGEFSCQHSRYVSSHDHCCEDTAATYRATVNGTSDLITANQVISHIEDWQEVRGTLLHGVFRLRLVRNCTTQISSIDEEECDTMLSV